MQQCNTKYFCYNNKEIFFKVVTLKNSIHPSVFLMFMSSKSSDLAVKLNWDTLWCKYVFGGPTSCVAIDSYNIHVKVVLMMSLNSCDTL